MRNHDRTRTDMLRDAVIRWNSMAITRSLSFAKLKWDHMLMSIHCTHTYVSVCVCGRTKMAIFRRFLYLFYFVRFTIESKVWSLIEIPSHSPANWPGQSFQQSFNLRLEFKFTWTFLDNKIRGGDHNKSLWPSDNGMTEHIAPTDQANK